MTNHLLEMLVDSLLELYRAERFLKLTRPTCTSPIVSNTMVNLIINLGKIVNFYWSCSMRHSSWQADKWIFFSPAIGEKDLGKQKVLFVTSSKSS